MNNCFVVSDDFEQAIATIIGSDREQEAISILLESHFKKFNDNEKKLYELNSVARAVHKINKDKNSAISALTEEYI